ncbi:MAG: D-glycero-beta-D-manno-heptose-7-phosphate kinase [Proteobacteria bacterium]|nr:D-glycero-beta-D-manno-heptose-7-phosphate kinase [Pseudomonadota bacterium]
MTNQSDLIALVESLPRARVLCVGDVMLDRFVHGAVERISPEAPIPVLRVQREAIMLGGGGNVARNLNALGAGCVFVSAVGDDDAGRELAGLFGELRGTHAELITDTARQTAIKTRYLAGNQQMLRADRESTDALAADAAAKVVAAVRAALRDCAVVVLSDYGKGVLDGAVLTTVIEAARDADRPVIVDPKGSDYSRYRGATLITPNRAELAEASRMATDDDAAVVAAARHIIETCGVGAVLATRSRDGMTLITAEGAISQLPTEAREVFDVSGAGDTVVATLAAALAAGAGLELAAALANVAAGIVVGKVGTAAAHADEVIAALHHREISNAEAKVIALQPALDRIARWRRQGLRVGFTNGVFDLLHPGHVTLLSKARAACDRLVVGLNADSSVKRLKGPTRPLQAEAARATVLASLAAVDMVVLFGEDTPIVLIEAIRPDLLVKGADYRVEDVVGADIVQAGGGKVLLVDLEAGFSTTATVNLMRA